jgi:hypothetical protein
MTHVTLASIHLLPLIALTIWSLPLRAADQIQVHWNEVCAAARGKQLTIQTVDGSTVDGYCLSINVDEIAITTKDQRIVRIARKALSRINVQRSKNDGHQLRALGREIHKGLRKEVDWLLSPYAPLGIVAVPATLAWGAVSAPFCLLGDLTHASGGAREIKVI